MESYEFVDEFNRTERIKQLPAIHHRTGKKLFSKIDLSDAFLQVELDQVNTHLGLFQINRLQPGVKTAPGAFQELMCKMLCIEGAFAFVDDIVLGASSENEHKKLLFNVLEFGFKLASRNANFVNRKYFSVVISSTSKEFDQTLKKSSIFKQFQDQQN